MINLIGLSCLTLLFMISEPSILLKRFMGFKEEEYTTYSDLKKFFFRLITCSLCSGWWISIIYFLIVEQRVAIMESAIISILSELLYRLNNKI